MWLLGFKLVESLCRMLVSVLRTWYHIPETPQTLGIKLSLLDLIRASYAS